MTPQERKILEDAEQQAFETSQQLNESLSRGVRPSPEITETEVALQGGGFGLTFGKEGVGQANVNNTPGAFVPPAPRVGPFGACCIGSSCFILSNAECDALGGIYQGDDTACSPNPC